MMLGKKRRRFKYGKNIKKSKFRQAWWLPGPHFQTVFPTLTKKKRIEPEFEILDLPDGDFVELAWYPRKSEAVKDSPIIIALHGLQGSVESPYAQGIMESCAKKGWRTVLMHFRGCGKTMNKLPQSYHSGQTNDLAYLVDKIHREEPNATLMAAGFSLGGNVLLKYLGEMAHNTPIKTAAAVCVPLDLSLTSKRISKGISKIYRNRLLKSLKRSFLGKKIKRGLPREVQIPLRELKRLKNFEDFDEIVTAPLNGFESALDYYKKSSSRQFLKSIEVPTLIIQAINDPFMPPDVIPNQDELSDKITLELSRSGGHVGFVGGSLPWRPKFWLEERIPNFFTSCLDEEEVDSAS